MSKNKLMLLFMAGFLLLTAGCREEESTGRTDRAVPSEQSEQREEEIAMPEEGEDAVSEDTYIEYVAQVQIRQGKYQNEYLEAAQSGDSEQIQKVRQKIEQEAYSVMNDLGISPEEVEAFESQNPGYLEDPDVQRKIAERKQELSQE